MQNNVTQKYYLFLELHQNVKPSFRVWANLLWNAFFKVPKMEELKIDHSTWIQLPAVSNVCSIYEHLKELQNNL